MKQPIKTAASQTDTTIKSVNRRIFARVGLTLLALLMMAVIVFSMSVA